MAVIPQRRAGSAKRTRRSIRQFALVVLVSVMFAAGASAQNATPGQPAASGPGTSDRRVDANLQVPRCLRGDSPLEPAHEVVPSRSRRFTTHLGLLTLCSFGIRVDPVRALGERRSGSESTVDADIATSFEQLEVLVRAGDAVTLTDTTGSQVTGRIDTLTSSTLSLVVDDALRDFDQADVAVIRQTDSLANGAWRGFALGGGLAVLSLAGSIGQGWGSPASAVAGAGALAALGAGIGVGIDALVREHRAIYRRPAVSAATVTISPHRAGATMSFRF